MKKISKSNLKGLMEMFPMYSNEAMRKMVGGLTDAEILSQLEAGLGNQGYGFFDNLGNMLWFSSYDSFFSSYSAYLGNGYVDFGHSGYFYLSDGNGGYITYYNSVFGFGPNEVIPQGAICFFAGIASIRGMSIEQVFTEYKNMGYAYNNATGVYASEAEAFLRIKNYGTPVPLDQANIGGNSNQSVLAFSIEYYGGSNNQILHAFKIISKKDANTYSCRDSITGYVYEKSRSELSNTAYYINNY
jgi:hypothetical protein